MLFIQGGFVFYLKVVTICETEVAKSHDSWRWIWRRNLIWVRKRLSLLWSSFFFFLGSVIPDVGLTVQFSFCHNDSLVRVQSCLKKSPHLGLLPCLCTVLTYYCHHILKVFTQWFIFTFYSCWYPHQLRWVCDRTSPHHIATHPWIMMNPQEWPLEFLLRKIFSLGSNVSGKEWEEKIRRYTRFGQQTARALGGFQIWFITILLKSWLLLQCSQD